MLNFNSFLITKPILDLKESSKIARQDLKHCIKKESSTNFDDFFILMRESLIYEYIDPDL